MIQLNDNEKTFFQQIVLDAIGMDDVQEVAAENTKEKFEQWFSDRLDDIVAQRFLRNQEILEKASNPETKEGQRFRIELAEKLNRG